MGVLGWHVYMLACVYHRKDLERLMDVYFINTLLACAIAYIVGYWVGRHQTERRFTRMLEAAVHAKIVAYRQANVADNDTTKH